MICFYHCDDDGKCAGSIVRKYGRKDEFEERYIEMNYGYAVPFDKIHNNEIIYIVDFSISTEDMLKLLDITKNVIWIDHHISAIQRYDNFEYTIEGVRSIKHSGCMLTFLYLTDRLNLVDESPDNLIQSEEIPVLINLCDDYDMWRFQIQETKKFHAGFSIIPHDPTDDIWNKIDLKTLEDIVSNGDAIVKYRANLMNDIIKSYGFECTFNDYKCFVINQGLVSSEDFNCIDTSKYDILVGYIYDGNMKTYSYSLRSLESGPDVRKIAEQFGGGGHIHAAGFSCSDMIFK